MLNVCIPTEELTARLEGLLADALLFDLLDVLRLRAARIISGEPLFSLAPSPFLSCSTWFWFLIYHFLLVPSRFTFANDSIVRRSISHSLFAFAFNGADARQQHRYMHTYSAARPRVLRGGRAGGAGRVFRARV